MHTANITPERSQRSAMPDTQLESLTIVGGCSGHICLLGPHEVEQYLLGAGLVCLLAAACAVAFLLVTVF